VTDKNIAIFGVCDGHGKEGHSVSKFLKEKMPKHFETCIKKSQQNFDEILTKIFEKCDADLVDAPIDD